MTTSKTSGASDVDHAKAVAQACSLGRALARAARCVALIGAVFASPLGAAFAASSGTAVPPLDTTPWLASVQAPKTPFFTRESDAQGVSFHFTNSGRYVARGREVVVSETADGDMWQGGMVHATYIDGAGVETSGWLVRSHLRQVKKFAPPSAWDGRWRGSAGARRLIVHGDRISYSFASGAQSRVEMLLRLRPVSDDEAMLSRMQVPDGVCDLDVRRLGDYLVVSARDCFIPGANPEGILRKQR
ncbi:hypothetical protein BTRA_3250 [Burkholderia thailandensis USAMRU Malaysia |uniref:hypothetical protein n=1 Tax=Burkholderia thailandensis TaxID=57975 RepID=UPI0003EC9461|nr:hypothetical protein [Burkholderia thailandensis]AHI78408.1 hypothetical protein BTJ_1656 [Burkholderia thailandensis E444]AIC87416.1 hypothetical protein BTRA_3250 [Burkholderia thailandensis USAMRU Malaysia \